MQAELTALDVVRVSNLVVKWKLKRDVCLAAQILLLGVGHAYAGHALAKSAGERCGAERPRVPLWGADKDCGVHAFFLVRQIYRAAGMYRTLFVTWFCAAKNCQ